MKVIFLALSFLASVDPTWALKCHGDQACTGNTGFISLGDDSCNGPQACSYNEVVRNRCIFHGRKGSYSH